MSNYPVWKYHKDPKKSKAEDFKCSIHPPPKEHGARMFLSEEELEDAGEGWVDHPEELKEAKEPKEPKEPKVPKKAKEPKEPKKDKAE
jgi:hypothetical protein